MREGVGWSGKETSQKTKIRTECVRREILVEEKDQGFWNKSAAAWVMIKEILIGILAAAPTQSSDFRNNYVSLKVDTQ